MAKVKVKTPKKVTVELTLTEREAVAIRDILSKVNGDVIEVCQVWNALSSITLRDANFEYRYSHGHPGLWEVK